MTPLVYKELIAKYYMSCFHQAGGQELIQRPAQLHGSNYARVPSFSLSAPLPRQQRWTSSLIHRHIDGKAPHGFPLHTNSLAFSRSEKNNEWEHTPERAPKKNLGVQNT